MNILEKHEIFEIEVLEKLNSNRLLQPLVFGGGTMLRLCYELERYSADLDFWFIRKTSLNSYFEKFQKVLEKDYDLTDAQLKYFTLLFEIRSGKYPKRLKIEIRKEIKDCDFQDRIAYSKYSNTQLILKTHTLKQAMKNKINALQDRSEIRDAYDIEFLLRKGAPLPNLNEEQKRKVIQKVDSFTEKDFKVKLGSILESENRKYYVTNRFIYLKEKLSA